MNFVKVQGNLIRNTEDLVTFDGYLISPISVELQHFPPAKFLQKN